MVVITIKQVVWNKWLLKSLLTDYMYVVALLGQSHSGRQRRVILRGGLSVTRGDNLQDGGGIVRSNAPKV